MHDMQVVGGFIQWLIKTTARVCARRCLPWFFNKIIYAINIASLLTFFFAVDFDKLQKSIFRSKCIQRLCHLLTCANKNILISLTNCFENIQINWRSNKKKQKFSRWLTLQLLKQQELIWFTVVRKSQINWILLLRFAVHFNCRRYLHFLIKTALRAKRKKKHFAEKISWNLIVFCFLKVKFFYFVQRWIWRRFLTVTKISSWTNF